MWMVDEKESYLSYTLARIRKLHEGDDNIAGMATIKAAIGTYLQPVVKIFFFMKVFCKNQIRAGYVAY